MDEYECQSCTPPYKVKVDGHEQPVAGNPYFDTITISVIHDRSIAKTAKKKPLMGRSFTAKFDGTQAPYQGSDECDGVSLKLIDERTVEESDLKNGKVVKISRWSLSPDGQTMHARFDDTRGHIQEQDGHKVQ